MVAICKRIETALEEALENGDEVRSCTLRLMLAAIRDRQSALQGDDATVVIEGPALRDLLCRMVSQREGSIQGYEEQGRTAEAERERREIDVIKSFLPRPMSREETETAVLTAIAETHASSIRDLGRVMSFLRDRYPGRIDICEAGAQVKASLG
ncbi:MAG: GatB/YqeY domain-containing protein [Pseudomonadota bacterium]